MQKGGRDAAAFSIFAFSSAIAGLVRDTTEVEEEGRRVRRGVVSPVHRMAGRRAA